MSVRLRTPGGTFICVTVAAPASVSGGKHQAVQSPLESNQERDTLRESRLRGKEKTAVI